MKKIPTIFERDWNGDRSRVVDQPHPDCAWVFAGEGQPTRKLDGTCCMVRSGKLYKRREVKDSEVRPLDFEQVDYDITTFKATGWVPVGDGPEDRWHREAFNDGVEWEDGTYELIGPKVQGNPERFDTHALIEHGPFLWLHDGVVPRDFAGLRDWLAEADMEGVVFHHPDGRMAKIKLRDFGLKRGQLADANIKKPTHTEESKDERLRHEHSHEPGCDGVGTLLHADPRAIRGFRA